MQDMKNNINTLDIIIMFLVLFLCFFIPWVLVRRSLSSHYTLETLLNHVFEDLRKPKAPNSMERELDHLVTIDCFERIVAAQTLNLLII